MQGLHFHHHQMSPDRLQIQAEPSLLLHFVSEAVVFPFRHLADPARLLLLRLLPLPLQQLRYP